MVDNYRGKKWGVTIIVLIISVFLIFFIEPMFSNTSYTINTCENIRGVRGAPSPITNLSVYNRGDGESAYLTWSANNDPNFDHYNVYQNETEILDDVTGMKPINSSIKDNSTTNYTATGLICGFTYWFAVTAVNTLGEENTAVKSVNITVNAFTLNTQPLAEIVGGNITVEVKVNLTKADIQYVAISIDKGVWMECNYNSFSRNYEYFWNTTHEPDGEHTIDACATNKYDVTRYAEQTLIYVGNQHFTIYFNPGWNLITLPLDTMYKWAGGLANTIPNCTHIGEWNFSNQQFDFYVKNTDSNNFTLQQGLGYMVYTNTSSSLTLTGMNITITTINLNKGWNSIGWFNITTTTAEALAQNITNCTFVAYWNATLCRFILHPTNTDISDFAVEQGRGYFVYVTKESTWINQ